MEQQLIALYLHVCRAYHNQPDLKFQRLSNFRPRFTDEELLTIYLFGHMQGLYQQRRIYDYVHSHWRGWFPCLPSYQAFNRRLKLHVMALRRRGKLPLPALFHVSRASQHDLSALRELWPDLGTGYLFGDKAYADEETKKALCERGTHLLTPSKRRRNEPVSAEPAVRSSNGLFVHCYGKLAVACLLLTFYS